MGESDSDSIKALAKLMRNMKPSIKAVASMKPFIDSLLSAVPAMHDAERAKHLNELVKSLMKSPINVAINEIQAEIDRGVPLTGRQTLFLIMEAGGIDVPESLRQLAEIGRKVKEGGEKGHESTYGALESKDVARKQWQLWVDKTANEHLDWSFETIKKSVAKNNSGRVSIHQLKRYTKDPRKK